MTPPTTRDTRRLRRINALLEAALALPAEMRKAWLAALPPQDQAHHATLRSMLARVEVETDDFLRQPLALGDDDADASAETSAETAGERIGPYRLVQVLGRGGMATVWLAEREGDPAAGGLHRCVALKLPAVGWCGSGLARRMARERDLLAALEHPRIARLYEAGVTPEGRPWLAMELVDGLPLDQFCKRGALNVEQRLRLFLQIADAVAYAHARLIVHRDLKPANVLVNAQGEVRLLDFGVATLLQPDADLAAHPTQAPTRDNTRAMGRAITPDYASPEQVGGHAVTVATDVYSLGVVLFELLTGRRPYTLPRRSLAALEEAILHAEVPLASACVGRDARRARQLRGDLDTILHKALQKTADRRYASVEAMAADVQRHLDGEPVRARPPSRRYRLAKLLRRHWRMAGALGAVLLALGSGLAVATVQWREAQRQRASAQQQLARAQAALDFTNAVLTQGIQHDEQLTMAQLLRRSHAFVEREATPMARALSADQLAALYLSYGNYREAEPLLARAIAELPAQTDPPMQRQLRCKQAHAWSQLGRRMEAVAQLEAVLAAAAAAGDASVASYCLRQRAQIARNENQAGAALAYAQESLRQLDRAEQERPLDRAMVRSELAYAQALGGRFDLADAEYGYAMAQHERHGRGEGITAVPVLNNWGIALLNSGRPLLALQRFEQAAAISRRRSPEGQLPSYLIGNLANTQRVLGRFDAARAGFRQMHAVIVQGGGQKTGQAYALAMEAQCLLRLGQLPAARAALDAARALHQQMAEPLPATAPAQAGLLMAQAQLHLAQGHWSQAQAALDTLIEASAAAALRTGPLVLAHLARAEAALHSQGPEAALAQAQAALTMAQELQQGLPHSSLVGQAWLALGALHRQAGRAAAAHQAYAQALDHLTATAGGQHFQAVQAQQALRDLE